MPDLTLEELQERFPTGSHVRYSPRGNFDAGHRQENGVVTGYSSSGEGVYVQFEDDIGAKYVYPRTLRLVSCPTPPPAYSAWDEDSPEVVAAIDADPKVQEIRARHDPYLDTAEGFRAAVMMAAVEGEPFIVRGVTFTPSNRPDPLAPTQAAARAPVANGPSPLTEERAEWWAARLYDAMEYSRYTVDLTEEQVRAHDIGWEHENPTLDTMRGLLAEAGVEVTW